MIFFNLVIVACVCSATAADLITNRPNNNIRLSTSRTTSKTTSTRTTSTTTTEYIMRSKKYSSPAPIPPRPSSTDFIIRAAYEDRTPGPPQYIMLTTPIAEVPIPPNSRTPWNDTGYSFAGLTSNYSAAARFRFDPPGGDKVTTTLTLPPAHPRGPGPFVYELTMGNSVPANANKLIFESHGNGTQGWYFLPPKLSIEPHSQRKIWTDEILLNAERPLVSGWKGCTRYPWRPLAPMLRESGAVLFDVDTKDGFTDCDAERRGDCWVAAKYCHPVHLAKVAIYL